MNVELEHYPVWKCTSNWTVSRRGAMINGMFVWQLFDDGVLVAVTERPCTAVQAQEFAQEYIRKQEASE